MSVTGVGSRQRIVANFPQHRSCTEVSLYAGVWVTLSVWLLVRRLTASSVEFMGIYSSFPCTLVVTDGLCAHFAVARCQLHPAAGLDSALSRKFRRHFNEGARRLLANALGSIRHVAFMEMFQKTAVVQVQVVLGVRLIGWAPSRERDRMSPCRQGN